MWTTLIVLCLMWALPSGAKLSSSKNALIEQAHREMAVTNSTTVLNVFNVTTTVHTRLAETIIAMEFENMDNCSKTFAMTLPLPRAARLTHLQLELNDGCVLSSIVKRLEDAQEDFDRQVSQGKPAAIVSAYDLQNYQLQVSLPPVGSTFVTLRYEELLRQKLHQVKFLLPLYPGIDVGELYLNILVDDPTSEVKSLAVEGLVEEGTLHRVLQETGDEAFSPSLHYKGLDITSQSALPRLATAYFEPGPLPEEGIFLSDGDCFTHLFNPTTFLATTGSMPKKIIFVIDVSGSMDGGKLEDAKAAFSAILQSLDPEDTFYVQAFSDKGTESLWGPHSASLQNKALAVEFVAGLSVMGSTNLYGAYVDAINRVYEAEEGHVSVLVILTDGQGNEGPQTTARGIREVNYQGKVKIFGLAFGADADMDLLLGVSLQNGGKTVRIYEGFGDAATQMAQFYQEELGSIFLSDIRLKYASDTLEISEATMSDFAVLAEGGELAVRGKWEVLDDSALTSRQADGSNAIRTMVEANNVVGSQVWMKAFAIDPEPSVREGMLRECHQSYAQGRIMELLEYHDAERALGSDLREGLSNAPDESISFQDLALELALDAGLVWPGLTAMVTVENNDNCEATYDVCHDGEGSNGLDHGGLDVTLPTAARQLLRRCTPLLAGRATSTGDYYCFFQSQLSLCYNKGQM